MAGLKSPFQVIRDLLTRRRRWVLCGERSQAPLERSGPASSTNEALDLIGPFLATLLALAPVALALEYLPPRSMCIEELDHPPQVSTQGVRCKVEGGGRASKSGLMRGIAAYRTGRDSRALKTRDAT